MNCIFAAGTVQLDWTGHSCVGYGIAAEGLHCVADLRWIDRAVQRLCIHDVAAVYRQSVDAVAAVEVYRTGRRSS